MPFDIDSARSTLADLALAHPARLQDRIRALARPRMTGSDGAAATEAQIRKAFEELGYRTQELPFTFSTWPGRFGICLAGGAMVLAGSLGAWLLAAGLPAAALALLLVAMGVALAPLLALDRALQRLPWGRVETRNLLFSLPESSPAWILMAHRDSKSQLVPTLVRMGAMSVAVLSWGALVLLAIVWWGGEPFRSTGVYTFLGVLLVLAGALLALSWSDNRSPGALDNASGLAALLAVAAESVRHGDVAFLVTDAEELGLVGARTALPWLPPVQGVINVDGLDDAGPFIVAEGFGWRREGSAPQLAAALLTAGAALDYPVERRRLPSGLPVDHMPLAEAGIPAVTVLRGGWSSLLRVHTPADDTTRLDGRGAASGATLLTAAVRLMREDRASHLAARRAPSS
jgi:hypothetical protein